MTTNGTLLEDLARPLWSAGLKRINISLDTLNPDRYCKITRGGNLSKALKGLEAALGVFKNVKINVVLLPDLSREEIKDFLRLAIRKNLEIRFLEYMPMGMISLGNALSPCDILSIAKTLAPFTATTCINQSATTSLYRFDNISGNSGSFGFITPMTNKFCATCNRLRLSCDGVLRGCLHSNLTSDLRASLRSSLTNQAFIDQELKNLFLQTIQSKPAEHKLDSHQKIINSESMYEIGG